MMIVGEQVNLAPIVIDETVIGSDIDGVTFAYDGITGWHLGGGVEANITNRPGQHGSFDGPTYRRARVIVLDGWAYAQTRAQLMTAVDQLAGILADGHLGSFTVGDPDLGDRTAMVRLSATPEASVWTDTTIRWQLTFTAPDYRKYGPGFSLHTGLSSGGTGLLYPLLYPLTYGVASTGGRVTFTNTGTGSIQPVITVSGPFAVGFEVVCIESGRRLRYEALVGADVVLDCAAGTATVMGQERSAYLTVREWCSVAPGETATFSLSSLGSETAASAPSAGMTIAANLAYL